MHLSTYFVAAWKSRQRKSILYLNSAFPVACYARVMSHALIHNSHAPTAGSYYHNQPWRVTEEIRCRINTEIYATRPSIHPPGVNPAKKINQRVTSPQRK